MSVTPFAEGPSAAPPVRGFLHSPAIGSGDALVLSHGAGSNCEAPVLVAVATTFADAGFLVLRCDLPFRQARRTGPPARADALRDRDGLRSAVDAVRHIASGRVVLGGHSYGGRQASMVAAEEPALTHALLLLSYPLHPPRRAGALRTAHFPRLRTPALFVHGSRDPFGSLDEVRTAVALIRAPTALLAIEGAAHDLAPGRRAGRTATPVAAQILAAFLDLIRSVNAAPGPGAN